MPDFIPRREAELLGWASNFDQKLAADPQAYGATPERAASFHALRLAFAEAFRVAMEPGTRTVPSVASKEAAKAAMIAEARAIAGMARVFPGISEARRVELGIGPKRAGRKSPIPAPGTAPTVRVVECRGWSVTFRLVDLESPHRIAKPAGVSAAMFFGAVGANYPTDRAAWPYLGTSTRTLATLTFPGELPPGTRVWLTACWLSPTQKRGPEARPVCALLAGDAAWAA